MATGIRKEKKFVDYLRWALPVYLFFIYSVCQIMKTDETLILPDRIETGMHRILQHPFDIGPVSAATIGIFAYIAFLFFGALYVEYLRHKRLRIDDASGTAAWNKDLKEYNKTYTFPKGKPYADRGGGDHNDWDKRNRNIILTNDIFLSMNGRDTFRNLNVLVAGGSGSGKSRYVVKPNLLQANCSFVVTDPKGELLASTGDFLKKRGYKIKVFNLSQMDHSCSYNPFNYIRDENGVLTMITALIQNTTPKEASKGDPFWGATCC